MYSVILAFTIIFFLGVFSQFGHRLAARHALMWWIAALFVTLAALKARILYTITEMLGVALPSNLVFAGLILFLSFLIIEQGSEQLKLSRTLREMISSAAARDFILKFQSLHKKLPPDPIQGPTRALVVLPCYNEESSLPNVIARIAKSIEVPEITVDYCFVNDGSQDGSEALLQKQMPNAYTNHSANIGVSGALMTGFKIGSQLEYDYVVQCDSDGQHPIELVAKLVEYARMAHADLLIGSRFTKKGFQSSFPVPEGYRAIESTTPLRRLGSILISTTLRVFRTGIAVSDPTSGLRVYSRRAVALLLKKMPDEYPEPETIALAAQLRLSIDEVKVPMAARTTGKSSLAGFKSARYMIKVASALLGLRLRSLF